MTVTFEANTLGETFAMTIKRNDDSLRDVVRKTGIGVSTLSRIQNGYAYRLECIIPLAEYCKLTPYQLWNLLDAERKERKRNAK